VEAWRSKVELSLEISKALGGLSDKLIEELNRLASIRQAVELEQKELQPAAQDRHRGHGSRQLFRIKVEKTQKRPRSPLARGLGRGIATHRARAKRE